MVTAARHIPFSDEEARGFSEVAARRLQRLDDLVIVELCTRWFHRVILRSALPHRRRAEIDEEHGGFIAAVLC
jgi:hypothetical protein